MTPRTFRPVYRPGETNRCPGCSATSWHVGRTSAECAMCFTAIPLASDPARALGLELAA
jgi:hypothetical protein